MRILRVITSFTFTATWAFIYVRSNAFICVLLQGNKMFSVSIRREINDNLVRYASQLTPSLRLISNSSWAFRGENLTESRRSCLFITNNEEFSFCLEDKGSESWSTIWEKLPSELGSHWINSTICHRDFPLRAQWLIIMFSSPMKKTSERKLSLIMMESSI